VEGGTLRRGGHCEGGCSEDATAVRRQGSEQRRALLRGVQGGV
jgi:hypothetical protein